MFVGGAGAAVDVDDAPGAVDAIEETQKKNSVCASADAHLLFPHGNWN